MYLDEKIIKKILIKNKIKNFKNLLISSVIKKNKIDSDIYKYFKKIEPGKKYLHIGDNKISDVINAKKVGINSFLVLNKKDIYLNSSLKLFKNNAINELDLSSLGLITNKIFVKENFSFFKKTNMPSINSYEDLGYIIFGPLLYYYIAWLIQISKKKKIKKILFCAREGYFMIKLFKFMIKKVKRESSFHSIYFKTSRRMAVVPSLKEFKDILLSFENHRFYGTGKNLLQNRLGVKPKISDVSKKLIFNSQENFKQFKKFLSVYKTSILKNAEYEKKITLNI